MLHGIGVICKNIGMSMLGAWALFFISSLILELKFGVSPDIGDFGMFVVVGALSMTILDIVRGEFKK